MTMQGKNKRHLISIIRYIIQIKRIQNIAFTATILYFANILVYKFNNTQDTYFTNWTYKI